MSNTSKPSSGNAGDMIEKIKPHAKTIAGGIIAIAVVFALVHFIPPMFKGGDEQKDHSAASQSNSSSSQKETGNAAQSLQEPAPSQEWVSIDIPAGGPDNWSTPVKVPIGYRACLEDDVKVLEVAISCLPRGSSEWQLTSCGKKTSAERYQSTTVEGKKINYRHVPESNLDCH